MAIGKGPNHRAQKWAMDPLKECNCQKRLLMKAMQMKPNTMKRETKIKLKFKILSKQFLGISQFFFLHFVSCTIETNQLRY